MEHQNEALKLKRLEKFYYKSFARDASFPQFSFIGHTLPGQSFFGERKNPLSLYGYKKPEKVETLNDNSLAGVMNAQEREENKQAVSNV